jgi:hypothetical protein
MECARVTTEQILLEAKIAVRQAQDNSIMHGVLVLCLIGGMVLGMDYLVRRWSWIPRKQQRRYFYEKL